MVSLPACSGKQGQEEAPVAVTHQEEEELAKVSLEGIMANVMQASSLEKMVADMAPLQELYGIDPESVTSYKLFVPEKNILANELLIIESPDTQVREMVKEAMEARRSEIAEIFSSYAPDQNALAQDGIISERGDFVLFVMDEDAHEINQAFNHSF